MGLALHSGSFEMHVTDVITALQGVILMDH